MPRPRLTALSTFVLSALCLAQEPPGAPPRPGEGGFGPPGFGQPGFGGPGRGMPRNETVEVLARFDADENGRLDQAEREQAKAWLAENRRQRDRPGFGGRRQPPGMPPFGDPVGNEQPASGLKARTLKPTDVATYTDRPLFDPDVMRTVFLDFAEDGWFEELTAFYHTDVLVPATVAIDGQTYRDVGVRFRGNTSYMMVRGEKKPIDLEFDFVHGKQNVRGVRNLDLLNCNHDASMMREALHGWISNHYLPASRVALVRVVIGGEDHGIYAAVEAFDKEFLAEHFGSKKGARFKVPPDFSGNGGLRFLGEDPAAYERNYELRSGADPEAWAALVDLCAVLEHTPTEDLAHILPQHLAIDTALWFLAVDNALGDDDGYHSRASDYVLYRDPKGLFHPLARDNNEVLLGERRGPPGGRPGFRPGGQLPPREREAGDGQTDRGDGRQRSDRQRRDGGRRGGPGGGTADSPLAMADRRDRPLLRRMLEVPQWRARYLANLRELATTAMSPEVVGARLEIWRELIAPVVAEDAYSQQGFLAFQREFAVDEQGQPASGSLLAVIEKRRRAILDDTALQGPWPEVSDQVATYAVTDEGDEALHVRCRVGGAQIDRVLLHHDRGKFGAFATTVMHDDGRHGDGKAGDGTYGGRLPKAKAGDDWRYWIEAVAVGGHVDCLPAGGGAMPFRWQAPE